ncbi:hypothetical protein [Vitiosangium sp. GDMCC 1.1324]|nr:hypothetical protein [Vitiosangium sp. GDMCC 1.1324]
MNGGLHMYFGNVTNPDEVELKAVMVVAAVWFCLSVVLLSGRM